MANEKDFTNKPPKAREWEILFYTDNDLHMSEFNALLNDNRFVAIVHDRDIKEGGELKKEHIHGVYKFDNASSIGSVLKLIPNHESNLINPVKSCRSMMRYLVHRDNPEKTSYSPAELLGNASLALRYLNDSDMEGEKMLRVIEYIEAYDGYLRFRDFFRWTIENKLYDVIRRNSYLIKEIVREANEDWVSGRQKND